MTNRATYLPSPASRLSPAFPAQPPSSDCGLLALSPRLRTTLLNLSSQPLSAPFNSTHRDRAMRDAYVFFEPNPPQILKWRARLLDRQADYNVMTPTPQNTMRAVPVLKGRLVESARSATTVWACPRGYCACPWASRRISPCLRFLHSPPNLPCMSCLRISFKTAYSFARTPTESRDSF